MKTFKVMFVLGVLGLAIYTGIMFGMPYYKFYTFKSDAKEILNFPVDTDEQMKDNLMRKARDVGIPIVENDLVLQRRENYYSLRVEWSETVNILNQYRKRLDFKFELPEER